MSIGKCFVRGCSGVRGERKLMCLAHWRRVPAELQQRVYDTERAWKGARTRLAATQARRRWIAAATAARAAVEKESHA